MEHPKSLLDVARMDEDAARAYLEAVLWPDGPVCPHCGVVGTAYALKGEKHRKGLWKCREKECRKQFTVTVGTVMHRSHIPLATWVTAFYLMNCHKKSISARQLRRDLGIGSMKSSWFLAHRIRKAMERRDDGTTLKGVVAADESFLDGSKRNMHKSKRATVPLEGNRQKVIVALVTKDGEVRTKTVPNVTAKSLRTALVDVDDSATLVTDDHTAYPPIAKRFAAHKTVNHSEDEYLNAEGFSTNPAESYFALAKRAVYGTYHNVSKAHLSRYLAEWDHRWRHNDKKDGEVAALAIEGAKGRRLTYLEPRS